MEEVVGLGYACSGDLFFSGGELESNKRGKKQPLEEMSFVKERLRKRIESKEVQCIDRDEEHRRKKESAMLQVSGGGCPSKRGAVSAQRAWRRLIKRSTLPRQSSRARDPHRRTSSRNDRCDSEGEGEGSTTSSDHDVPFRGNERLTCIGCNKRRPSFSDTESKMPVGTTSSVLKSSFSLTSLRSSTPSGSPEHAAPLRINTERPYHSLTKKSRENGGRGKEQEQWRKSWGSGISQDGKEFWEGFQADYDYLMAQNMLERDLAEAEEDQKGIPRAPGVWSQSEFMEQFAALYSWLAGVQDSVHGKMEKEWKMRAERLEDMQRQRFRLEKLREESRKLIGKCPEREGEVVCRVKEIGEKWERVEGMVKGCNKCEGERGDAKEKAVEEIRRLKVWLRELEAKLKPLSFQHEWTKAELEAKAKEHMVLHRDIQGHRKVLSSLLKHCEKVESPRISAAARTLERKYLLHYLRSLEWQYLIESLISHHNKGSSNASNESDGQPVRKIARFACMPEGPETKYDESDYSEGTDSVRSSEEEFLTKDDDWSMDTSVEANLADPQSLPAMADGVRGRGPRLGTESENADASISCANRKSESTPESTESTSGGQEHRGVTTGAEAAEGNRRKEKPPNTGTFTLMHLDTDSEQEKTMTKEEEKGGRDADTTSSEGGWTYKPSNGPETPTGASVQQNPKVPVRLDFKGEEPKQMKHFSAKNIPPTQELLSSSRLVEYADELFRRKTGKSWKSGRRGRTKKRKEVNNYDASGENTDEEGGIGGWRWDVWGDGGATASEGKKCRRHRPLSMSNVSCLRSGRSHSWKSRSSVSESALNQMPEYCLGYGRSGNRTLAGEDGSSGSAKKRRSKMRKLTDKKSESGTDGLTLSGSESSNCLSPGQEIATLVKSGSFSGVSRRQREEGLTGSETEEDSTRRLMAPVFRLGPSAGTVTVAGEQDKGQVEEQHSLNWDSYEEKYQSEVCSEEPVDSETTKKLLEFGEDYGKFFGNQSDSASTRNLLLAGCGRCKLDSDSDVNDVRQTLRQSVEQLEMWKRKFGKAVGELTSDSDAAVEDYVGNGTFLDEVIGVCKKNMECLSKLLVEVKDEVFLSQEHEDALNVKDSWENLKSTAELHKAKQLQVEMALLRDELLTLAARVDAMETTVASREELEGKITQVQNELNLMKKTKNRLLQANVSVHRFLASAKHANTALKDEVTELYQVWDQTSSRVSSQLTNLQTLSQTWHDFEDHLAQLQCALRTDTLKVLDFALQRGPPTSGVSLSLQDIARILSDRESASKEAAMTEAAPHGKPVAPVLSALSTEGSLSDSGISDSGSEQELSDREKRLAQLKRLAKRLESVLAPGSQALSNMFKRIEQAESELRELQKTCRDLIVRSASSDEIRMIVATTPTLGDLDLEKGLSTPEALQSENRGRSLSSGETSPKEAGSAAVGSDATDCEGGKPGKKFWLWRLLCYALPFQLALVAILCLTGMLEPRCCDSLNNLELSLHPQLRYNSGPPPV